MAIGSGAINLKVDGLSCWLCRTREEKELCRDFSFEVMKTPLYGLRDIAFLDPDLLTVDRYVYFAAFSTQTNELRATFRADAQYSIARFMNLNAEVRSIWRRGGLAEASFYPSPAVTLKERIDLFSALLALGLYWCRSSGIHAMYAQVRRQDRHVYANLGFEDVADPSGTTFLAAGWDHQWCPVIVRTDLLSHIGSSIGSSPGTRFNARFWERVGMLISQTRVCMSASDSGDGMGTDDRSCDAARMPVARQLHELKALGIPLNPA